MPIRKRITDPDGTDTKEFNHRLKYGAPPPAPRKPSATERKPFMDAIEALPVGRAFTNAEWRDRYIMPNMKRSFSLWGVELAIYPTAKRDTRNLDVCTGVYIKMLVKNARTGQFPAISLPADKKEQWYGMVVRWIGTQCYGE